MRDSAQLRRDLTVVQRYLASLRTLHGDSSGRFARSPRTPATPPALRPAGSTPSDDADHLTGSRPLAQLGSG
jgi:hypothetical protein